MSTPLNLSPRTQSPFALVALLRRSLSKPILAGVLLVPLLACGGGGGGSSPTAPPPPPPPPPLASLAGTWTGSATSSSATGTCLAENFRPVTVPVTWRITQSGASILILSETPTGNFIVCGWRGIVTGNTFSFEYSRADSHTYCPDPSRLSPNRCSNGTRVMEQPLTSEWRGSGSVSGNSIEVSSSGPFRVTSAGSGEFLGIFTVYGTVSLTRQN